MDNYKCKLVPEPHQDHKAVFRQKSTELPYFDGDDYEGEYEQKVKYICGKCDFILAKNIHVDQIKQLLHTDNKDEGVILQCPKCQSFNELSTDLSLD